MVTIILLLRILHIFAAATLIGSVIYNYVILRPSLRLIPTAHAVVIGQRTGTWFMWLGWITLITLGLTGGLRLLVQDRFLDLFSLAYYESGAGRAVGFMVLAWLVAVGSSAAMTFLLRPVLMHKLGINSNPDLAAVEKRRAAQMSANTWLERLQLINLVFTLLAALNGASAMYGGLI